MELPRRQKSYQLSWLDASLTPFLSKDGLMGFNGTPCHRPENACQAFRETVFSLPSVGAAFAVPQGKITGAFRADDFCQYDRAAG
jgi:hypothetical protein